MRDEALTTWPGQADGEPVEISIDADAVTVGARRIEWIDLDVVRVSPLDVRLEPWDAPPIRLSHLARRHDAFVADLTEARARSRRAALLEWTGDAPLASFSSRPPDGEATVVLFADSVNVERLDGPSEHSPLALVDHVERDGYVISLHRRGLEPHLIHRLGQQTDEFLQRLGKARTQLAERTNEAYAELDPGLSGLGAPDGWAIDREAAGTRWDALRSAVAGQERAEQVAVLEELAGSRLRLGSKRQPGGSLTFALAPVGDRVAVEGTDTGARATFVFRTEDVDRLNATLLLTSFRREAIAAPDDQLGRWALAVRSSAVVRWARAALVERVVHDDRWRDHVAAALRG